MPDLNKFEILNYVRNCHYGRENAVTFSVLDNNWRCLDERWTV
jgi:hypothetical protein